LTRIFIELQASLDIEEAARWYEAQRSGLGIEFVLEADFAIERIQENPKLYLQLYRGIRRVLLHRFPYAIYFFANDTETRVLAVLHQARSDKTIGKKLL
jgi:plasmid stabilization system protein ParE